MSQRLKRFLRMMMFPRFLQSQPMASQELKTVLVGEQFTLDLLPKATINPIPGPMTSLSHDNFLGVTIRGVITVAIQDKPKDWFNDVILPMGAVVDAILADRKLGGVCKDCVTTEFAPGEIKFKDASGKDRLLYGGGFT